MDPVYDRPIVLPPKYKVFDKTDFKEAQATCHAEGMEIVSIHSDEESAYIQSLIDEQFSSSPQLLRRKKETEVDEDESSEPQLDQPIGSYEKFWVGVNYENQGDNWTWFDGSLKNYTKQIESPTACEVGSACILINNSGVWMSGCCDEQYPFVCTTKYIQECPNLIQPHVFEQNAAELRRIEERLTAEAEAERIRLEEEERIRALPWDGAGTPPTFWHSTDKMSFTDA